MTTARKCRSCDAKVFPALSQCASCGKPYAGNVRVAGVQRPPRERAEAAEFLFTLCFTFLFAAALSGGVVLFFLTHSRNPSTGEIEWIGLSREIPWDGVAAGWSVYFLLGLLPAFLVGRRLRSIVWPLVLSPVERKALRGGMAREREQEKEQKGREAAEATKRKQREAAAEAQKRQLEEASWAELKGRANADPTNWLIDCGETIAVGFAPADNTVTFYGRRSATPRSHGPADFVAVKVIDEQNTIITSDRISQLGGALVGGVVFGEAGAVVGGVSGSKEARGVCERLAIEIVVRDPLNPTYVVEILRKPLWKKTGWQRHGGQYKAAMRQAQIWHGRILALMKQAADVSIAEAAPAQVGSTPLRSLGIDSLASELERLKKLHEQGDLTDQEFAAAKARVLAR